MKKQLLLLLLVLTLGLGGCKKGPVAGGNQAAPTGSSFILGVDCQCEGVRRINYSYYAGEERRGCGGTMTLDWTGELAGQQVEQVTLSPLSGQLTCPVQGHGGVVLHLKIHIP